MILFKNDFFVLVDKPSGLLTIPGRVAGKPDLKSLLEKQLGKKCFIVHRLDFEVSGLLLFALTAEAHRVANHWFEGKQVSKTYEAWTESCPDPIQALPWNWRSKLAKGKKRAFEAAHGQDTLTRVLKVLQDGEKGFWTLQPLTGKPHQLRFELSKHGHPVWGDVLYGSERKFPIANAMALRAVSLDFQACERRREFQLPESFSTKSLSEWFKINT